MAKQSSVVDAGELIDANVNAQGLPGVGSSELHDRDLRGPDQLKLAEGHFGRTRETNRLPQLAKNADDEAERASANCGTVIEKLAKLRDFYLTLARNCEKIKEIL